MAVNYKARVEIRDSRNGSWFWIHTHVWKDKRLSKADKVVYGTLAAYANSSNQTAFPSINRISLDSNISERHTYRSLKNLERLGYVGVKRKVGKPNQYILLKTTPDIKSPLTKRQQGGDKKTVGTPDKKTVLTRINKQELDTRVINSKDTHLEKHAHTLSKRSRKATSIKKITENDLDYVAQLYDVPLSFVRSKLEDLENYCARTGRVYKDYLAALRNFVKQDAIKIKKEQKDKSLII